jgi:hypothetical protein
MESKLRRDDGCLEDDVGDIGEEGAEAEEDGNPDRKKREKRRIRVSGELL